MTKNERRYLRHVSCLLPVKGKDEKHQNQGRRRIMAHKMDVCQFSVAPVFRDCKESSGIRKAADCVHAGVDVKLPRHGFFIKCFLLLIVERDPENAF